MASQPKCGILLANTGTPSAPTARSIRQFLSRFLIDKRIAPINRAAWWLILHLCILPSRGKKNVPKYEAIWTPEGSPSTIAHEKLAEGLQAAFHEQGFHQVEIVPGMSYSDPDIDSALRRLKDVGCERLIVLPLYPQSAHSTTGAVYDAVKRAMTKLDWDAPCQLIDNYHDNPVYTRAIAASVKHAGFEVDSDDRLLFSFHSIPVKDIEAGDTYELQTGASSLQIASELGLDRKRWTIGYQCRFDKGRDWVTPFTLDVLDRWAEAGGGRIFFVCPGFAVDCLETLYDIDYEILPHYKAAYEATGRPWSPELFSYVPCLDKTRAHVVVLQEVLTPYVKEL